jgi:ribosomal protein S18 acetylase RimI-like enzyme
LSFTSSQGDPIAIRTDLRPGDIGTITAMHGILYATEYGWNHTFEAYVGEHLSKFAASGRDGDERIWIAERIAGGGAAQIVGCIAIVRAEPSVAQLRWFLVDPSARGVGLGNMLIDKALEFSRAAGYSKIVLDTVRDLTAAARLYTAAGFEIVDEVESEGWGKAVIEQRYALDLGVA